MKNVLRLILIVAITIQLNSQQSKWNWVNPYPTGANLTNNIFFNEQRGIVAGERKTILVTTNAGERWTQSSIETDDDFVIKQLFFVDSLNGWLFGYRSNSGPSSKVFNTTDGGLIWVQQSIPENSEVWKIYFLDQNNGWATAGINKILKTTNGGNNWIEKLIPSSDNYVITDISFSSPSDGVFIAYTNNSMMILGTTTDGGDSWIIKKSRLQQSIFGTAKLLNNKILSFSEKGLILASNDNGSSFSFEMDSPEYNFFDFCFSGFSKGIIGCDNGYILKSTNEGQTWVELNTGYQGNVTDVNIFENYLSANLFPNFNEGTGPYILTSNDEGINWENKARFIDNVINLNDIAPIDSQIIWICGDDQNYNDPSYIYKSTNSGNDWQLNYQSNFYYDSYSDIEFITPSLGYVCGGRNNTALLIVTTDGGLNWSEITNGLYNTLYQLNYFNIDTIFVHDYSRILKIINLGTIWEAISLPNDDPIISLSVQDENTFYALSNSSGTYKVYRSTNGGISWSSSDLISGIIPKTIHFASETVGYIGGSGAYLFKSTDGGITWNYIYSNTNYDFYIQKFSFKDETNGWAIQPSGIISTTDGGLTWESELKTPYFIGLKSIISKENAGFYVVGNLSSILKYNDENTSTVITNHKDILPLQFNLHQNYPNPFNPYTKIKFDLPLQTKVSLEIYDVLGNEIEKLVDEYRSAGRYEVEWNASKYASGVYLYRLHAGSFIETKKMILIR